MGLGCMGGRKEGFGVALADPARDKGAAGFDRVALHSDAVRAFKGLERALETGWLVRVQCEEWLARANGIPRLGVQVDTGGMVNRVLLAGPSSTEAPGGDTERQRGLRNENAVTIGGHDLALARARQHGIRIAALG